MTSATDVSASIDAFLDRNRGALIELLEDLVSIDSQIPPFADERRIVEFLRSRFEELSLGKSEVLAADPHRPNLITRLSGSGGGRTLMLTATSTQSPSATPAPSGLPIP